jgi:hypothetical protein
MLSKANDIGRPFGVVVKHERDRYTRQMKFNFYRAGRWIGGTSLESRVVAMMKKYVDNSK